MSDSRDPALPEPLLPPLPLDEPTVFSRRHLLLHLCLLALLLLVLFFSNRPQTRSTGMHDGFYGGVRRTGESVVSKTRLRLNGLDVLHAITALNVIVFVAQSCRTMPASFFQQHFSCTTLAAALRRPWSLLLSAFAHLNVVHLAMNMASLFAVAPLALRLLGVKTFLLFYIAAANASSLGSLKLRSLQRDAYFYSLGASGAIYALEAFASLAGRSITYFFGTIALSPLQAMCLQLAFEHSTMSEVDVGGHISGALFGAVVAVLWSL